MALALPMDKKPKKSQAPPAAAPAADAAAASTPMPAPRSKRVKEIPLTAKEKSRAAKQAARARWMLKNP